MQYRFIVQKNQDGTMSSDCATACEVLKEQNWLHQDEAPYLVQLKAGHVPVSGRPRHFRGPGGEH